MQNINFKELYDLLVSFLGESKQGGYDKNVTQYQFNCPNCAEEKGYVDNKFNFETNLAAGVCHCWRCGFSGPISRAIKEYGGKDALTEYYRIIKDIKESSFYDIGLFKDSGDKNIFNEEYLHLPKTFTKIDLKTCKKKDLVEYLKKRHITQDIIDYYNIGYTTWDEEDWQWRNRIIVPSYDTNGDLNYYTGRTFKANDKRQKYRNAENVKKDDVMIHEGKVSFDADIYLVEGCFDAIYGNGNVVPLLGKTLTKKSVTYQRIHENANAKVVICLDGDTDIKETKRIYNLLNSGRLLGRVWYIDMSKNPHSWKDFGETYEDAEKNGIIELMKSARQFTEIEQVV